MLCQIKVNKRCSAHLGSDTKEGYHYISCKFFSTASGSHYASDPHLSIDMQRTVFSEVECIPGSGTDACLQNLGQGVESG